MTKSELAKLIMENTDEYKKSHLDKMHLADLERIATAYLPAEVPSPSPEMAITEPEASSYIGIPENAETALESPAAHVMADAVMLAYEEHAKMVKGSRIDKEEFRAVAIEKALGKLAGDEDAAAINEATLATMNELLTNKTAFCPINDTERLMLGTIPQLEDFEDTNSVIDGKGFLAKVKELHGVETATSRALMVSLMRKKYYRIIGARSGQKHTTIQLLERGMRFLGLSS